jgi:Bacterial Ig domain/PASTA domain
VTRLPIIGLALVTASAVIAPPTIGAGRPDAVGQPAAVQVSAASPVPIGDLLAGTFKDATGHSAQSHLVYAANSRVWWLFTLTSNADTQGGSTHVVKSFRSSGPDLTTATWTAGADSPALAAGSPNQSLGGGRSLGIAYLNNNPTDVIHADVSMAFDGQDGRTGHVRAVVTGTSITWSSWNVFDEGAATWTLPRGNTIGVSSGKFIHTGGPILQQEVDTNARKSNNADTGSTWTSGFSAPAVIDGSMANQNNALAFAPLASNVMLAVYDNGQGTEPNLTNLRYERSNANGTWSGIVVGSQIGGDGNVFSTNATINQNDWALVSVSTTEIYVFRRKSNGSGVDAASYNSAANTWSAMSPAPPSFGAGQSFKAGAGLFGATDGNNVWVCVINTDVSNSILCARFDGTAWTPWSAVPGTDIGTQNRNYISGFPRVGNNKVGLIWTEGSSLFDIVAYSFAASADVKAPIVSLSAPASGATVSGTISITATASDNVAVAGVQFRLDGGDLGSEDTLSPYTISWNTTTAANGTHTLTAIARDAAGNLATSGSVSVTVANAENTVPNVVGLTQAGASSAIADAGLKLGTVTTTTSTTVPAGSVISQNPAAGTKVASGTAVALVVSSGPGVTGSTLPSGWISTDVGAVGTAGSASYANPTFTLKGAGTDIFNTADAFQFTHRRFSGDGDLIARVASLVKPTGANAAYAGIMFRESLGANVRHATLLMGADGRVKFRRRTTVGGTTASDGSSIGTAFAPRYIKLSRRANVFTAWISVDGSQWTQVYTPQTVTLPVTTEVGIWTLRAGAVSGLAQATFTNVTATVALPAGWKHADVGAVGTPGNVSFANATYTINGAGTDLWSTADAFHFVYRSLSGNGTVVARLGSVTKPANAAWAMGAIMMRDGTAANARHVALMVTTDAKAKFRRRTTIGGTTLSDGPSAGTTPAPRWLKLTRVGNTFTAYLSTDGLTWTSVGPPQTISLPTTLQVGLLTLRSGGTGTAQAVFTKVSVTNP